MEKKGQIMNLEMHTIRNPRNRKWKLMQKNKLGKQYQEHIDAEWSEIACKNRKFSREFEKLSEVIRIVPHFTIKFIKDK